EYPLGGGIDVIFGGGRTGFLPSEAFDPEHSEQPGRRQDRVDLIRKWLDDGADRAVQDGRRRFVSDRASFEALGAGPGGNIMGLFEPSHMNYEHDRQDDPGGEPSLAEMTVKALEILQNRDSEGFVLMVEGARIDHAHHAGNAYRALTDTIAFSDAIAATLERIDLQQTLVIVTADHGHSLAFGGYPSRGNPILGLVRGSGPAGEPEALARDLDGKPYTTLSYSNGPGFRAGSRPDYDRIDPRDPDFRQEAAVGLSSATHSGEDVAVYATGPGADVLHGSIEQHLIFHAMLQAQPALATEAERIKSPDGLPNWAKLLDRYRRAGSLTGGQTMGEQRSSDPSR
ncbi:MAG: alkaline phosphatase, partial [Wenzhouxiangellaceae bacterium]